MPPEIFTHIAGYEFRELLGQGGFGAVCKAIDKLGREVAIKVLTLSEDDGPARDASNKAFLKEATTLAKLNHPNIVTVYGFDIDSTGKPYFVMEYLPGETLSKIIRSGRHLHLVEKLSIILQAAKALQFAHSVKPQAVVHRDVKPQNLMVMADGTVKLIDFGIAQISGAKSRTMDHIVGSLPYMSPEHWQPPVTLWGDIFSLGVVFYELLTGVAPYATEQDTVPVAYQKLVSNAPAPPLKQFLPDAPEGLEQVLEKVISKQKANSYPDAQQFWIELSRIYNRIKPQFLAEGLARATAAKNAGDYATASELVQKLLGIDAANDDATVLQSEISQALHNQQRSVKVRAICERVEEALLSKKFDLAQLGLDEAMQIDPASPTVVMLSQRVGQARELYAKIETLIADAEKHKQSGRWKDAAEVVGEALALDRTNTLALNIRAGIERVLAREHQLLQDARSALDQLRFQEAFEMIRQAELLAPDSERVKALKEFAVSVHREQTLRQEVDAAFRRALRLFEADDLEPARRELQLAIARYPDQKKLLGLRDTVELKLAEVQREQFVRDECLAAERESAAGNPVAALTRLEQALGRFPSEARLRNAAEQARNRISTQEHDKRKTLYLASARESLKAQDAAKAIVTLEMGLAEFANDRELHALLAQARSIEAEKTREIEESEQINQITTLALTAAEQADFDSGAKMIEVAGSRFGERPELKAVMKRIATMRSTHADQHIETAVASAVSLAQANQFTEAMQVLITAAPFAAYASPAARQKWEKAKAASERRLAASSQPASQAARAAAAKAPLFAADLPLSRDLSATSIMRADIVTKGVIPDEEAPTTPIPSSQPSWADPAPAPGLGEPTKPSKKLVYVGIAIAVALGLSSLLYFGLRSASRRETDTPSVAATKIRFEIDPPGTQIAVDGQHCTAPCDLNFKPGNYTLQAHHDGYAAVEKKMLVGTHAEIVSLKLPALRPTVGLVVIATNLDQVDVYVDGAFRGATSDRKLSFPVVQGKHEVTVSKLGYVASAQRVDAAADKEAKLQFTLNPTTEEPKETYLLFKSQPGAAIRIDDQGVGEIQPDGGFTFQTKPGKHRVALSLNGYESWSNNINPRAGDRFSVNAPLKAIPKPPPSIMTFAPSFYDIQSGQSVELRWDTQNSAEITIEPGIGTVPASGAKSVTPTGTATYTLTAKGEGPVARKSVTITVVSPLKPSITTFESGSDKIRQGDSTKLIWATQNATEAFISELGSVPLKGPRSVSPSKTTTYTLTAKGPGGSVSQSVEITVDATSISMPPVVSVQPTPVPVPPAENQEIKAVKEAIEVRYKAAYQSMDTDRMQKAWLSMSKDMRNEIDSSFKRLQAIQVSFHCAETTITGDSAQSTCMQTMSVTRDRRQQDPQSAQVVFKLKRISGIWYISAVNIVKK